MEFSALNSAFCGVVEGFFVFLKFKKSFKIKGFLVLKAIILPIRAIALRVFIF